MYEAFFGLRSRPFSPLPRVETFIPLAPMRESLDTLIRCIDQRQGIGVLTAPSGAGKSLLCRLLHHRFKDLQRTVLLTTARFSTRRALLQAILFELKHPYVGLSEQEARLRLFDLLQASHAPMNRLLLIVDEAHLLSPRGLEELRTLTDYEVQGAPCVSLILSGQLELEEQLTEPAMNALNQRVGSHACIEPLTYEESSQFVRERLRLAGNGGLTIFTPEAIQLICSASEGNPRRLNQLADHCLLLAFAEECCPVDVPLVRAALLDLRELPLHWNAPLDLLPSTPCNPLEAFAATHLLEDSADPDLHSNTHDPEFDLEEDSAWEERHAAEVGRSGAAVIEFGTCQQASPLDPMFQADRFSIPAQAVVDGYDSESPSLTKNPPSTSEAANTFETVSTACEATTESESASNEEHEEPEHAGVAFNSPWSIHPLPVHPVESIRGTHMEELIVEDTYASLDQLAELSAPIPACRLESPWTKALDRHQVPPAQEPPTSGHPIPVTTNHEDWNDLDDTLFEKDFSRTSSFAMTPAPNEAVQTLPLEEQLMEYINEISVDVRQMRDEVISSRTVPDQTNDSVARGGETPRPRHQSLRQSLNWQFDVVEPERADHHSESEITGTPMSQQSSAGIDVVQETTGHSEKPGQELHPPALAKDRLYAQLFTRLQRQRQCVETVMHREMRRESEFHSR